MCACAGVSVCVCFFLFSYECNCMFVFVANAGLPAAVPCSAPSQCAALTRSSPALDACAANNHLHTHTHTHAQRFVYAVAFFRKMHSFFYGQRCRRWRRRDAATALQLLFCMLLFSISLIWATFHSRTHIAHNGNQSGKDEEGGRGR